MGIFGLLRGNQQNANQAVQSQRQDAYSTCGPQGCGTASEFRGNIRQAVPAVDLLERNQTYAGNRTQSPQITGSSVAPSTYSSSATATTSSTIAKTFKDTGDFTLMDGVNVRVDNLGRISATIAVTEAQANGKAIRASFSGTVGNDRFTQPGIDINVANVSANVDYDRGTVILSESKSGAQNLFHVQAQAKVDSITITIPGKGPITLSRDDILKKVAEAEKVKTAPAASAEPATAPAAAAAPTAAVDPGKVNTSATAADYDVNLSAHAGEVERVLQADGGWLSNSPADPQFGQKIDKILANYPTTTDRARLINQIGADKLGELIHEVTEFSPVLDKFLAALPENGSTRLKNAVDLLSGEYAKTFSEYDLTKVQQGLNTLRDLEIKAPGADTLAKLYWSKIANDAAYVSASSYEDMVQELSSAITSSPAAAPSTDYDLTLSAHAGEVEKVLQADGGWLSNSPADSQFGQKIDEILANYPTTADRAKLINQIGADKLGELIHEVTEFSPVLDKFLAALPENGSTQLKNAVELLKSEYAKTFSAYDLTKIQQGLRTLSSLEDRSPGAATLAKLYWAKIENDSAFFSASSYEDMITKLQGAVSE